MAVQQEEDWGDTVFTPTPPAEDWDAEIAANPAPPFVIPGKARLKTVHRFLLTCSACGSRDCTGHGDYLRRVKEFDKDQAKRSKPVEKKM